MKRAAALFLALLLIFSLAACVSNKPETEARTPTPAPTEEETPKPEPTAEPTPEPTEAPTPEPTLDPADARHASEETLQFARELVKTMAVENYDFNPSYGLRIEDVYFNYKKGLPELAELEEKPDSALALLDLYEEYAAELTVERYAEMCQNRKRGLEDDSYVWREEDPEGFVLWTTPMVLESLLSFDEYFPRFEQAEKDRFVAAFLDMHNKMTEANLQVFGQDTDFYSVRFIQLRGTRFLSMNLVFKDGVWQTEEKDNSGME